MKCSPNQLFNSQCGIKDGVLAILLFGPDLGLVSETATRCIESVAGNPINPFMIAELTPAQLKDDPPLLTDELRALPMMGRNKITIVRQATDTIAPICETTIPLITSSNYLLVEAGDLPSRSKLRKIFTNEKHAAAVGCYSDDQNNIKSLIRGIMDERGVHIDPDALIELCVRLGNDRMVSRNEIERLALYAGEGGQINIDDVVNIVGQNSMVSLEKVVFAAADGNVKLTDQALIQALDTGISPVQVLRALQSHLQRLHIVNGELLCGNPMHEALAQLRPPIFFKMKGRFQQQCQKWSLSQLSQGMDLLLRAEQKCKQTGFPATAICQRAVLRLALAAQRQN